MGNFFFVFICTNCELTSLYSRQAIRISDRTTTPVRPTPALQWTSTGRLVFFGSLMLFVCLLTDWISSK